MEVRIEHVEPMRVAFVRHVGPYHEVNVAWERLCMQLGKDGLLGPGTRFIGICYDDPEVTPPEKVRYDACVTVDSDFAAARRTSASRPSAAANTPSRLTSDLTTCWGRPTRSCWASGCPAAAASCGRSRRWSST